MTPRPIILNRTPPRPLRIERSDGARIEIHRHGLAGKDGEPGQNGQDGTAGLPTTLRGGSF
jgi:hypothetical protein